MNLFVDTNTYLSFYHFTSDDLEELKKVAALLESSRVRLLVPDQVVSEFWRSRETKIEDALRRLREQSLNLQFPQLCKDYPEYKKLRKCQSGYEEHHAKLIDKILSDVTEKTLKADSAIEQLFDLSDTLDTGDDVLSRARERCERGNPPGKKGALGDRLIWEALLSAIPKGEDLHLVSGDRDYCSPLDESRPDQYLLDEWSREKDSKLHLYKRLSSFFKEHFPEIQLASEAEKEMLIRELADSPSFAATHHVVRQLRQHDDYTTEQLNELVRAACWNNQVYWIIDDPDVRGLLTDVTKDRESELDGELRERLEWLLAPAVAVPEVEEEIEEEEEEELDDDDLPF